MLDDLIANYPYLVPAAIVLLVVLLLLQYLVARRGRPPRPNLRSLEKEADKEGTAGRKEEEQRIKAIFEDFRRKGNSL